MFYLKEKTFFLEALNLQKEFCQKVRSSHEDYFFITSHYPCYTLAENKKDLLKEQQYPTYLVKRGGTWTFHHLDQFILYTHFYLSPQRSLKKIFYFLLQTMKKSLEEFFSETFSIQDGLWFNNKKILSIGLGVDQRVTFHGIALNLSLDQKMIALLKPCSLQPDQYKGLKDFFVFNEQDLKKYLQKSFQKEYELEFLKNSSVT